MLAAGAAVCQWFAALATGRPARSLHRFLAAYLRYSTHVGAYVTLLASPFPGFFGRPGRYPVDLVVPGPEPQPRWKTLLRAPLAIPAWVLAGVLGQVLQWTALVGWFVALAIGRLPDGMQRLEAYCLRYGSQTFGYLLLLTDRYPSIATAEVYAPTQ